MSIPSRGGVIRQAGSEAEVSPAVLDQATPFTEASTVAGGDVNPPTLTMADILRDVSARYQIPAKRITAPVTPRGPQPRGLLAWARNEACWLMRQQGITFPRIARFMNRHHSSIMHSCELHAARLARDVDMPFVVVRTTGRLVFVAPVGAVKPYTRSLNRARRWRTMEGAAADCKDNERPAHISELTA